MTFRKVKQLIDKQLGKVQAHEAMHYELLLDAWRIYLAAHEETITKGVVLDTKFGPRTNPAIPSRDGAFKMILKLSEKFGITPISRDLTQGGDDGLAALLGDNDS